MSPTMTPLAFAAAASRAVRLSFSSSSAVFFLGGSGSGSAVESSSGAGTDGSGVGTAASKSSIMPPASLPSVAAGASRDDTGGGVVSDDASVFFSSASLFRSPSLNRRARVSACVMSEWCLASTILSTASRASASDPAATTPFGRSALESSPRGLGTGGCVGCRSPTPRPRSLRPSSFAFSVTFSAICDVVSSSRSLAFSSAGAAAESTLLRASVNLASALAAAWARKFITRDVLGAREQWRTVREIRRLGCEKMSPTAHFLGREGTAGGTAANSDGDHDVATFNVPVGRLRAGERVRNARDGARG